MVPANHRGILSSFMRLHDVMYSEGRGSINECHAQQMALLKTIHKYFLPHALGVVWENKGSLGKPWILVRRNKSTMGHRSEPGVFHQPPLVSSVTLPSLPSIHPSPHLQHVCGRTSCQKRKLRLSILLSYEAMSLKQDEFVLTVESDQWMHQFQSK